MFVLSIKDCPITDRLGTCAIQAMWYFLPTLAEVCLEVGHGVSHLDCYLKDL